MLQPNKTAQNPPTVVPQQKTGTLVPAQRTGGLIPVQRTGAGLVPMTTGGLLPAQPTGFVPITAQPTGFIPIQATGILQPQVTFGIIPLQPGVTTFNIQKLDQREQPAHHQPLHLDNNQHSNQLLFLCKLVM